jgi:hypothetical protein
MSDRSQVAEEVVEALGGLAAALEEPAGRSRFLRGLAIGALIGAAVVGALLGMGARRDHGRGSDGVSPGSRPRP